MYINKYKPIGVDPSQPTVIDVEFIGFQAAVNIVPSYYFSGPNITYSMIVNKMPSEFKLSYHALEKISFIQTSTIELEFLSFQISGDTLLLYTDTSIFIYNYQEDQSSQWLNISKPQAVESCPIGQIVYWLDEENLPMITVYFSFSETIIQSWQPLTKCTIFLSYQNYLLCAGLKIIDIYYLELNSKLYYRIIEVSQMFQFDPLNLVDACLTVPSDISTSTYLYILDQFTGVHIVDLGLVTNDASIYFLEERIKVTEAIRILGTPESIYLVYLDGTIKCFTTRLVYLKTIRSNVEGTLVSVKNMANIIFVHVSDTIVVIDGRQTAHNGMFTTLETERTCQFDVYLEIQAASGLLGTMCKSSKNQVLNFYASLCPTLPLSESCVLSSTASVIMTEPAIANSLVYKAELILVASNQVSTIMLPIVLSFYPDGQNI